MQHQKKNVYITLDTDGTNDVLRMFIRKTFRYHINRDRYFHPAESKLSAYTTMYAFPARFYERVFTEFRRGLVIRWQQVFVLYDISPLTIENVRFNPFHAKAICRQYSLCCVFLQDNNILNKSDEHLIETMT